MIDFLLHLSLALAGGVAYAAVMVGCLVALERLCRERPKVAKPRLAPRGFDVLPCTSRWDEDDERWYRSN